jgi:hypothetical protein
MINRRLKRKICTQEIKLRQCISISDLSGMRYRSIKWTRDIYIYIHKLLICRFLYHQVSLKTWNRRRNLLSKQLTSSVVHNTSVCPVLTAVNCCSFVTLRSWCLYICSTYFLHIIFCCNIWFLKIRVVYYYYYYYCLHSPLTCLNGKNIFFLPDLQSSQLGAPRSLSLTKLNFAYSLRFVFRMINNNKQLLLSKYISSHLSAQWRRCMFTARYELDVAVLCSRIRTLTDLLRIFKRGSTCGQFIRTHKLNLSTVNSSGWRWCWLYLRSVTAVCLDELTITVQSLSVARVSAKSACRYLPETDAVDISVVLYIPIHTHIPWTHKCVTKTAGYGASHNTQIYTMFTV